MGINNKDIVLAKKGYYELTVRVDVNQRTDNPKEHSFMVVKRVIDGNITSVQQRGFCDLQDAMDYFIKQTA